jgi:uracil-DNA glycosylase
MLRELELLPVWKLRQPMPDFIQAQTPAVALQTLDAANMPEVLELPAETSVALEASAAIDAPPEIASAEMATELSKPLRALISEELTYLFLMQSAMQDEAAEVLLKNMLRAMRLICRFEAENTAEHIFSQYTPKLIICFGAEAANQLTQQSLDMSQWRSHQPHHFQQMPMIVTFTPQYLLQHNQDKALVWQDLCLAMQLVQSL